MRNAALKSLQSLRMQKVQAVNANFSQFVDANANPSLHQMVTQMISDKVQVEENEDDQPAADVASARQMAGFDVKLIGARKDAPKLTVGGVAQDRRERGPRAPAGDRHRGGPSGIWCCRNRWTARPSACRFRVRCRCSTAPAPAPTSASHVIADNITGPSPTTTQFSDCVRLREGPDPVVNVPAGLDVGGLAEIGLETAGMTSQQASDFLHTVDWKATLTLAVPRALRSYQVVKVNGTDGTLLSMAGRRGPGYALHLDQERHRLFAHGIRRFQPGGHAGRFAEVNGSRLCPSRIASPFGPRICARTSETRSRCAT